ncbi:MAG TPA: helix-turn-helix domain-containing protein [Candidatus Limnocylindrales bacterium]|nr:helix-turn-helix domain-containing protein [Candidatus Limnocylindrales bacterium]
MVTRDRRVDRGHRDAFKRLTLIGDERREARLSAGLSQREVAALVGVSHAEISRVELAQSRRVSYESLAVIGAVVGLDVTIRAFPSGEPVRDAGQLALLARLRALIAPTLRWRTEVPLHITGDRRAWDVEIGGGGWRAVVDAESRLRDVQALSRRITLKARDDGSDLVILLVADTRQNRQILRLAAPDLAGFFTTLGRQILAALSGARPPGSGIVVL